MRYSLFLPDCCSKSSLKFATLPRKIYARNLALNKKIPPRPLPPLRPSNKLEKSRDREFIRYTALNQLYRPIISLVRPATHVDRIVFLRKESRTRIAPVPRFKTDKKLYVYTYFGYRYRGIKILILPTKERNRDFTFPSEKIFFFSRFFLSQSGWIHHPSRGQSDFTDRSSALGREIHSWEEKRRDWFTGSVDFSWHRIYETVPRIALTGPSIDATILSLESWPIDDATFPREYTDLRFIVFRYSNDIPGYIVAALATFRTDPERDTSLSLLDADNGSSTWWPGPSLFQIRYQLSRLAYNRQSKS